MDNQDEFGETLITLTADIVSAHVSNNSVAVSDLIAAVHNALGGCRAPGLIPAIARGLRDR